MLPMPTTCWLCQMPLTFAHHGICSVCLRHLPPLPTCCPRCGLPSASARKECGACLLKPPYWHQMIMVSDWRPPLSDWVKRLKFYQATALSAMLARLLLLSWLDARRKHKLRRPDLLLCVPLHPSRAWLRGYNQMDDVTRHLARWLKCRYALAGISRHRKTRIQHQLLATARRRNLRGAFRVEIAVKGLHIALTDDVVTTGSTVGEISRILLAAGAASVQVWSLCRTL